MAQYVTKTTTTEAYKIGEANPPDWFDEAVKADKLIPMFGANSFCIQKWILRHKNGDCIVAIGDYIVNTNGELSVEAGTPFETLYTFDDARLLTVLTETDATPTGKGTAALPFVWDIAVANGVSTVALANITAGTDATFKLYSDAFTTEVTGVNTIALTAGTAVAAYIKVTSAAGTNIIYYKVNITRAAA